MSLKVDGERRRDRSRSRSRDRRPRDEEPEFAPPTYADVREPSYVYPEDDLDYGRKSKSKSKSSRRRDAEEELPYPSGQGMDAMLPGSESLYRYDDRKSSYRDSPPNPPPASHIPGGFPEDRDDDEDDTDRRSKRKEHRSSKSDRSDKYGRHDKYDRDDKYERNDRYDEREQGLVRYEDPSEKHDRDSEEDKLRFLPQKYSKRYDEGKSNGKKSYRSSRRDEDEDDDLAYGRASPLPPRGESPPTYGSYIPSSQYDDKRSSYSSRPDYDDRKRSGRREDDEYDSRHSRNDSYYDSRREEPKRGEDKKRESKYREDPSYDSKYDPRHDPKYDPRYDPKYDPTYDSKHDKRDKYDPYDKYESKHDSKHDKYDKYESRQDKYESKYDKEREEPKSSKSRDDKSRDDDDRRHRESKSSKSSALVVASSDHTRDRSRDRRRDASPAPNVLTVDPDRRDRDRSRDRRGGTRDKSPMPTNRGSSLTVDTARPAAMTLAAAPGSPLLESYHGTYQDCSPMPSPLLLASQNPSDDPRIMDALSPLNSDVEGDGKKKGRRARFHDPEDIASRLADALRGTKPPDTEPLVEILPSLSHEQVMELRVEYKHLVKTGSERKGVNIAKHIRARLKDEDPLLMKACYSVALGMWESEAYWANFWYQGDKTRRELLIETLMGRTNEEIRLIKDGFTDKKYDNSLTKCMKMELKEDKFKKAVLMVLDERRMDEYDHYGRRLPIDYDLVDKDVKDLRHAVKAEKGGESAMIAIVVQRSDSHLRAVLKEYEQHYRANFARESLKKSGNLVVSNENVSNVHWMRTN